MEGADRNGSCKLQLHWTKTVGSLGQHLHPFLSITCSRIFTFQSSAWFSGEHAAYLPAPSGCPSPPGSVSFSLEVCVIPHRCPFLFLICFPFDDLFITYEFIQHFFLNVFKTKMKCSFSLAFFSLIISVSLVLRDPMFKCFLSWRHSSGSLKPIAMLLACLPFLSKP